MKNFLFFLFLSIGVLGIAQSNFTKNFNEGANLLQVDKYNEAAKKFSTALSYKMEESNRYRIVDAYLYRGLCKYNLNNYEGAIDDFNEAMGLKPEYVKTYQFKTFVYNAQKKYEKSIESIDIGLKYRPDDLELLQTKSTILFLQKKYDDSNVILKSVLETNPKEISAIKGIGNNFMYKKLWDSAAVYYNMAIEINPLDIGSYYNLGIVKSHMLDYSNAKIDIEKAMRLDTVSTYVGYNNLGFFLKLEQKQYAEAIEYFDKAIAMNPKFSYAYSNRSYAKLMIGDIKGAYKDVKKSIEIDNTNSYAFKNLAKICLKDGKTKDACVNLKKAIDLGYADSYDDEVDILLKENCK